MNIAPRKRSSRYDTRATRAIANCWRRRLDPFTKQTPPGVLLWAVIKTWPPDAEHFVAANQLAIRGYPARRAKGPAKILSPRGSCARRELARAVTRAALSTGTDKANLHSVRRSASRNLLPTSRPPRELLSRTGPQNSAGATRRVCAAWMIRPPLTRAPNLPECCGEAIAELPETGRFVAPPDYLTPEIGYRPRRSAGPRRSAAVLIGNNDSVPDRLDF